MDAWFSLWILIGKKWTRSVGIILCTGKQFKSQSQLFSHSYCFFYRKLAKSFLFWTNIFIRTQTYTQYNYQIKLTVNMYGYQFSIQKFDCQLCCWDIISYRTVCKLLKRLHHRALTCVISIPTQNLVNCVHIVAIHKSWLSHHYKRFYECYWSTDITSWQSTRFALIFWIGIKVSTTNACVSIIVQIGSITHRNGK